MTDWPPKHWVNYLAPERPPVAAKKRTARAWWRKAKPTPEEVAERLALAGLVVVWCDARHMPHSGEYVAAAIVTVGGEVVKRAVSPGTAKTNVEAEVAAMLFGARLAVKLTEPGRPVHFRGDCETAVNLVARKEQRCRDARACELAADLKDELAGRAFTATWVPRKQNKAADRLTRSGTKNPILG